MGLALRTGLRARGKLFLSVWALRMTRLILTAAFTLALACGWAAWLLIIGAGAP